MPGSIGRIQLLPRNAIYWLVSQTAQPDIKSAKEIHGAVEAKPKDPIQHSLQSQPLVGDGGVKVKGNKKKNYGK